jgi:hypothetical protein
MIHRLWRSTTDISNIASGRKDVSYRRFMTLPTKGLHDSCDARDVGKAGMHPKICSIGCKVQKTARTRGYQEGAKDGVVGAKTG